MEALEPRVLLSADLELLATTALSSTLGAAEAPVVDLGAPIQPLSAPLEAPAITGRLDVPGDQRRYRFTVGEARQVVVDSLTNRSDLTWTLVGPGDTAIASRGFASTDTNQFAGSPILSLDLGNYTLTVDGSGAATGDFGFRLLDLADAALVSTDTLVTGTLAQANWTNAFRFEAAAGEQFYFDRVSLTGNTPYWRVIGPANESLFGVPSFNDQDTRTILVGGTHTLLIEGDSTPSVAGPVS